MSTTVIRVPFIPTAPESLSWSADNLIAVGGGETLCILVPRQKGTWDVINLPASVFTVEEIPPIEAGLSSSAWSIGEEQSQRHIVSLAWSTAGIAKFDTCALAVLHSNHVLTIWECTGRPYDNTQWRRCLLINHAVRALYQQTMSSKLSPEKHLEQVQVSQRINSFAWAPDFRGVASMATGFQASRTSRLMAVGTARGDLLVLRISSPYDLFDLSDDGWTVEEVHRISARKIASARHAGDDHGRGDADIRLSHIAWSDWTTCGDLASNMISHLAFIAGGALFTVRLAVDHKTGMTGVAESSGGLQVSEVEGLSIPGVNVVTGPLRFLSDTTTAILFAADAIVSVDVETGAVRTHDLDGRWDEVTGLAETRDHNGAHHLHLASHLSTSSSKTSRLLGDLTAPSPEVRPHWRQAVNESKSRFNIANGLGRHVQDLVWGLTPSPSRDLVAVCVTCEPDSSPAHFIASMNMCDVDITAECSLTTSYWGGSAEVMHFSMRQHGSEVTERLVKGLAVINSLSTKSSAEDATGSLTTEKAIEHVRTALIDHPRAIHTRLERLAGLTDQTRPHPRLPRSEYAHNIDHMLDVAFNLAALKDDTLSARTLHSLQVVKAKLSNDSTAEFVPHERCIVCSQDLPFESLFWSRCASGHQYSRCALTFLSIQEPGQSKRCRLCDAQCFNEYALLTPDRTASQSKTSDEDFAKVLFTACNKCLYCGGKFVA